MNCSRENCPLEAVAALGIEFYPPKAVMEFYKVTHAMTTLCLNLCLCQPHLDVAIHDGPFAIMSKKDLKPLADLVTASCGTVVDLDASKVVRVEFAAKEYQMLQERRKQGGDNAE